MLDYGRNIESFCVLPDERRLVAGTLLGQLLVIDIDKFKILQEFEGHAGMVIALDAHPTLPYVCGLGVDHMASVWKYDDRGHLSPVARANLRLPRPENKHFFPPVTSVSQAIAFHPTERRLLTRTANGAVAEIVFDDEAFDFSWCRSFFVGCETGYVRYLDDPRQLFIAAGDGTVGIFDAAKREKPVLTYRYNHEQIHAAEHVEGTHYLLPSDSRRVIRLDVTGKTPPVVGPTIVRDHLERVDYNKKSKRAFVSSFDRRLYEVSPDTGQLVRVVAQTPMKCRWLKTLERDPDTLIAQCRNGALYKEQTYPASVSDFKLDRFEVTVGRFRPFVEAVIGGWRPTPGSGKHAHLHGGSGIAGNEIGWNEDFNDWLPKTRATWEDESHLGCDAELSAWTSAPGNNENRAMNCVSWIEAYAFCIWDDGFLPTEAEWNYAAAGGEEAREYPWGAASPAPDLAVYYCRSGGTPGCAHNVGSRPAGDGRFGQADMAGSSWEWVLDSFIEHQMDWQSCSSNSQLACTDYPIADCDDCAFLETTFANVMRGGSNTDAAKNLRSALRASFGTYETLNDIGLRCARSP